MVKSLTGKLLIVNMLSLTVLVIVIEISLFFFLTDPFAQLSSRHSISTRITPELFLKAIQPYFWLGILVGGLISGFLFGMLTRRMLKPIKKIKLLIRNIEAGHSAQTIATLKNNELEEISAIFEHMVEDIAKIENLRRVMLADIAHELRTPLTNLRGYIEGMIGSIVPSSQETLTLLHEEVMRLINLVENVVQLAKADHAKDNIRKTEFLLKPLIDKVLRYYEDTIAKKNLSVVTDMQDSEQFIHADGRLMLFVVRNLIQNAVEYTPRSGTITVSSAMEPSGMRVAVANTGKKIPNDRLPFIFERFFRVDVSRNRDRGGAGIGLAIVKGFVEAHGGRVGADSSDKQTAVWFFLPR